MDYKRMASEYLEEVAPRPPSWTAALGEPRPPGGGSAWARDEEMRPTCKATARPRAPAPRRPLPVTRGVEQAAYPGEVRWPPGGSPRGKRLPASRGSFGRRAPRPALKPPAGP